MNIKLSKTLNRYIGATYLVHFGLLLLMLLGIVFLFDMVELIRRAAKRDDVPFTLLVEMGLLKLPEVGQILLPFAVLFSAMFSFWSLNKRYELIVVRAAGFSAWQFLGPVVFAGLLLAAVHVMVVNPLGALLGSRYEQLENRYLNADDQQIAFLRDGLWLRQEIMPSKSGADATDGAMADNDNGFMIFHATSVEQQKWRLNDVTVFEFNADNAFIRRYDADGAQLRPTRWALEQGSVNDLRTAERRVFDSYDISTNLTPNEIEESFAPIETISFWALPDHIDMLETSGFDATRLKVHYQSLLAQPLLFTAMILLAASVSLRPPRNRGTMVLVMAGIVIGFIFFFGASFLQALGATRQLPVILAAWGPALIAFMLGLSAMMKLEDG